jgi:putative FmdB family regulatory protein
MPMFEFHCDACQENFEELLKSPEDPVECTECGSPRVTRRLSVFGFRSSGSGYIESAAPSSHGCSCSGCGGGNCGSCGH